MTTSFAARFDMEFAEEECVERTEERKPRHIPIHPNFSVTQFACPSQEALAAIRNMTATTEAIRRMAQVQRDEVRKLASVAAANARVRTFTGIPGTER